MIAYNCDCLPIMFKERDIAADSILQFSRLENSFFFFNYNSTGTQHHSIILKCPKLLLKQDKTQLSYNNWKWNKITIYQMI